MPHVLLEVCVDTPESVRNAVKGNADRLELCSSLILGGLTPSIGFTQFAVSYSSVPCYALIRPRNGNFIFSPDEVSLMEQDIFQLKKVGVKGFVIGALNDEGYIDLPTVKRLIKAAGNADITFHRAFDLVVDVKSALQTLMNVGIKRILSSGQQATALDGIAMIGELQRIAGDKLSIMAGTGINETNAETIITETGICEIHASCKSSQHSPFPGNSNASMGSNAEFDRTIWVTDKTKVQAIKSKIL